MASFTLAFRAATRAFADPVAPAFLALGRGQLLLSGKAQFAEHRHDAHEYEE
ncbi:MAG: hypothetical protein R6V38_10835 [Roseovarius gahaiensis]